MLALLQQAATIGAVLLMVSWAWVCVYIDQAVWAPAVAFFILGSYACVLAAEFLLSAVVNRSESTSLSGWMKLLAAWWHELLSAPRVFCWQQPFFSRRWPDNLTSDPAAPRGVLLIHGLLCNRGVWNDWLQRLTADRVPFVAVDLTPVFGPIDAYAETIEAAVARLERVTGAPPLVVAHSMGGLALRFWWCLPGNVGRVHKVITIATPHHGTLLARWSRTANTQQMRQRSAWLAALATRETAEQYARCICFYSTCDNIVIPAVSARLPGADNRRLDGPAHLHMISDPQTWQALRHLLPAR